LKQINKKLQMAKLLKSWENLASLQVWELILHKAGMVCFKDAGKIIKLKLHVNFSKISGHFQQEYRQRYKIRPSNLWRRYDLDLWLMTLKKNRNFFLSSWSIIVISCKILMLAV
jgi:hypothetical protein